MNSVNKGKQGEDLAVTFLQKQGYTIVARNFYYHKAEIDIIAQKEDILCIVEVKWRKSDFHGAPTNLLPLKSGNYWRELPNLLFKNTIGKAKPDLI
tara:strand:- start:303 stop:590 length:288 start_codon:yes stop_codon:yes gene_type:complete